MTRYLLPLRRSVLILGVLVGAGAAVGAAPSNVIGFRVAREQANLEMTPESVSGLNFQLARSPGRLNGRTSLGEVQLTLTANKVEGTIGTQLVNLKVTRDGQTVKAEGGFAGSPVTFRMSPEELHMYVRDCTYRLKAKGEGHYYVGPRSCDSVTVPPTEVSLPDEFLAAPPSEQATLLLLSLFPTNTSQAYAPPQRQVYQDAPPVRPAAATQQRQVGPRK